MYKYNFTNYRLSLERIRETYFGLNPLFLIIEPVADLSRVQKFGRPMRGKKIVVYDSSKNFKLLQKKKYGYLRQDLFGNSKDCILGTCNSGYFFSFERKFTGDNQIVTF